jgi:TrmH family RNA methyltransferase
MRFSQKMGFAAIASGRRFRHPPAHYNRLLLTAMLNPTLSSSQRDRIEVILVSPRNPLNIGAAARAMANFGFTRLTVVAPYAPHWREARSAVGAPQLLANARECATLAEAVAACTLVAGTGTLGPRKPEQRVLQLPGLSPMVNDALESSGRMALVFGPEKHGLTRDDLSFCHLLVEIPTDPAQPSMNLGQAVAVCLYELAVHAPLFSAGATRPSAAAPDLSGPAAQSGALDVLAAVVEQTMSAAGYSPRMMQTANRLDLRQFLRRIALSEADARRTLRLFRRILWRLNHSCSNSSSGPVD